MTSTPEHPSSLSSQPSRRVLLAGLALAASASALPALVAAAVPQEPDPHLAWLAEWRACLAHQNGPAGEAVDCLSELPEYHRALALEGLIGATPARTLGGVLAQLRITAHRQGELSGLSDPERAGLANAIATLGRLAGEGVMMDRRALLARAAATVPAADVPAIALEVPQTDPHVAWAAEAYRLRPIMNAADADTADALADRICELHALTVDTPARTVAGVREQARVLCHVLGLEDGERDGTYEGAAARNMLATLERLAEGVRA